MTTPRPAGRLRRSIALAAVLPTLLAVTFVAACAPKIDEAAAQDDLRATLASIEGVTSVEDFGTRTDYGKEIHAHLVMDPGSTIDPRGVLEQGIQVLWTWPAWRPEVSMTVEQGTEFVGATSLIDPSSQDAYLSPSDLTELFGEWPGEPVAGLPP